MNLDLIISPHRTVTMTFPTTCGTLIAALNALPPNTSGVRSLGKGFTLPELHPTGFTLGYIPFLSRNAFNISCTLAPASQHCTVTCAIRPATDNKAGLALTLWGIVPAIAIVGFMNPRLIAVPLLLLVPVPLLFCAIHWQLRACGRSLYRVFNALLSPDSGTGAYGA